MEKKVPLEYRPGYERVRMSNPELADKYVEYLWIGDPIADAAVESIADLNQQEVHRLIEAGMEENSAVFREVPQPVQDFFEHLAQPPAWFKPGACLPGCRLFHAYSDLFLGAFVADAIIRGFTTTISKPFVMRGRVLEFGERRLKQNIVQLVEIMLPGGLERQAEGWKRTVRIRLVHAQARMHIRKSGLWETESYGTPMHASHIAFANAVFSAILLRGAERLGARTTAESRASFMHIWRYTAWLLGIPEALAFHNEEEALELVRVGSACEPPPDVDAIMMGNTIINAAPVVVGITDAVERRTLARYIYRVSRALIGDEIADTLGYPKQRTLGVLRAQRMRRRLQEALARLIPGLARRQWEKTLGGLLDVAFMEDVGISYRLPDHLYAEDSSRW